MTSFLAGFVVFAVLGYMAQAQGVSIENLPTNGKMICCMIHKFKMKYKLDKICLYWNSLASCVEATN